MRYLSIFLCVKYLCRRKIVLLSVAAVAMSTALLIVVASLFTGFIAAFEEGIKEHSGDIVMVASRSVKISQYDKLIEKLEQNPVVESATAVLSSHGGLLFLGPGNVRAVQIMGIQMPKRSEVLPFKDALVRQKVSLDVPDFTYEDSEVPGGFVGIGVLTSPDEITDEYDMAVVNEFIGKDVGLTTGSAGSTKTRLVKFQISDVVHSGFHAADSEFVYLPIELVSEKFYPDQGSIADLLQIRLRPAIDTETAVAVIRGLWQDFAENDLGLNRYQVYQVTVKTSIEKYAELIGEYRKQMKILMLIFGVVSAGVVLLISCIFYAIVMTKRKDIAVVKSCGLGAGAVMTLFVAFGVITGFLGGLLGVVAGYYIIKNINVIENLISAALGMKLWKSSTYMFSRIPTEMDWSTALWVALIAIVAAGIGALIPAIVAALVKPVKILRYE